MALWDAYWTSHGRSDAADDPGAVLLGSWFASGEFPDDWALSSLYESRISDFAVVPYGHDKSARLNFRGSDARNPATEGDTLWVNYSTRRFSSRSTGS